MERNFANFFLRYLKSVFYKKAAEISSTYKICTEFPQSLTDLKYPNFNCIITNKTYECSNAILASSSLEIMSKGALKKVFRLV